MKILIFSVLFAWTAMLGTQIWMIQAPWITFWGACTVGTLIIIPLILWRDKEARR